MKLSFLGAASEVTGSNHLLETENGNFLFDCGLFQGSNWLHEKNYEDFDFDPKKINAVFLSHAHLDHCGRLPKLVKDGFNGKIYATAPTIELTEIVLNDSAKLMKEDEHKKSNSDHDPLFSIEDVIKTMSLMEEVEYDKSFNVGDASILFKDAGHILGSAFIEVKINNQIVAFSGDLGNSPVPLMEEPEKLDNARFLLIESTYGDRVHENLLSREDSIKNALEYITKTKGTLMIPAFALERTQEILYILNDLVEKQTIKKIPIYLDSPMAIDVTEVFKKYKKMFDDESKSKSEHGDDVFSFSGLTMTNSPEESKSINNVPGPKVIIAGSGMLHGGRILHHLTRYLSDSGSMLLFVGYQVSGTLGRIILDGEKKVKIFDQWIDVKAKIENATVFSAHADQNQISEWIAPANNSLQKIFLIHGEPEAATKLKEILSKQTKAEIIIPDLETVIEI